jgi:opacity protein-like surface antigen
MKRWALFCGVMLIFAGVASAQDAPRAELFGGYSFVRSGANNVNADFNGGSASGAYNFNSWLGAVADFGGYHGDADAGNANVYTYLFGPKVSYSRGPITPFAQALFGGAHATAGGLAASENSFAMTLGGGLDWNATPHLGLRLIQAEYLLTDFASIHQNGVRLSAGVIFRF